MLSGHAFDVVIVAPNAALDSYYDVEQLRVGEVNRARNVLHTAGGKGNNMARAVVKLGGRVLSLGIVGGRSGQFVVDELAREGIASDVVWTDRETRRCSTVPVPQLRQTTVFLEGGAPVGTAAREAFTTQIMRRAAEAPFVTLTGSLPPDFPASYYAEIIANLKSYPVRVSVDASGETLRRAAQAGPAIVKINLEEFQSAFAPGAWDPHIAGQVFADLKTHGLEILVITSGADGAYVFARDSEPLHVLTQVDTWVSTAGAGDTFTAGLLLALNRRERLEEAARFASAAAAASLQTVVCGVVEKSDLERFLPLTKVEKLAVGKGGR